MAESTYSKIANKVSPLIRRFLDLAIRKMGSFVEVLRITSTGKKDAYGKETGVSVSANIVTNVVIDYPLNEVELFDNVKDTSLNATSINLMDILPINMWTSFESTPLEDEELSSGELVDLERGDYIIHVLKDHKGNKLPIKLQVEKLIGSFYDRNLVTNQYEVSLVRGRLTTDMEALITNYVNGLE